MNRANFETRWIKFGSIKEFIYLGEDVIAVASGIFMMFLNLTTREERIELFDSAERGQGASCLAGHPVVPMFATAERRSHPKIFVFTYPGLRKISCCVLEKGSNACLSNAFAGTDHLVTLTDFPNFKMIIWQWRTGECLTSIDTNFVDHEQRITCSPTSPYLVSQIGMKSGVLGIYEISICSRIVSINPVGCTSGGPSTISDIVCASWTSDGNLMCCDSTGNVSMISNDGKKRHLIVRGEDDNSISSKKLLLENFRNGVILINRKSQILFYRKPTGSNRVKSGSPWKLSWSVQATSHPTCMARCPHRDVLLIFDDRGRIFEINVDDDDDTPELRILFNRGSNYRFVTAVNPTGDHVVAIDGHQRLDVLGCCTGQLAGFICLNDYGPVRSVVSHPSHPTIATATIHGKCVLINLVNISSPSISKIVHLHRESLDKIRYSWSGDILGVAHVLKSKLFLIHPSNDRKSSISELSHSPFVAIDFLIYEIDEKLSKILILEKKSKLRSCGRNIIIYSIDDKNNVEHCERVVELSAMLNSLNHGRTRDEIVVVPYLTRQLHFIKIQDNCRVLNLTLALSSGHQMRNIGINVNSSFVVTCGYDGLIIVRNKMDVRKIVTIFTTHHRQEGGAKFVIIPNCSDTVVCLGRNGDLVATKISNIEIVSEETDSKELEKSTEELAKDTNDENVTWVERNFAINLEKERESCIVERNSIIEDFFRVRDRLKHLLDANEKRSANSQLPISNFDLDHENRTKKINENTLNTMNLSSTLDEEILQRDGLSKYLLGLCWESMEIPACSLISIDGKTTIDNFPLARESKLERRRSDWLCFEATFEHPKSSKDETIGKFMENPVVIGTTSHLWIPEIPISIGNQIKKISNPTETRRLCAIVKNQKQKLKMCFNENFESMRDVKVRELNLAARRIDEIRDWTAELKNTFGIVGTSMEEFPQPLWHHSEKPEAIITVTNDEITSGRPAIFFKRDVGSEIIDDDGKLRVEFDDDFRGKALESMMDGLLEVRWEDEIKKIPVAPVCLSQKDCTIYTNEETASINSYRKKCQELKVQRDNYEKSLKDKISSTKEALANDAKAFDRRLDDLRLERMKIESAILQETLMGLRESQRQTFEREAVDETRMAENDVERGNEEFRNLVESTALLEIVVGETRNRYENLMKREKFLETKFRGEFGDLKQPMIEHLSRHYRKRPRNVQLTCTSITWLAEIARCLTVDEKSEILPRDCTEFLRGMDSLDSMPNNLPAQIDRGHWHLMCKLRRAKVELEIKIRSCAVDLAEADQTLASHQKSCANAELRLSRLRESLKEHRTKHSEASEDREIQLVMKMGQIELNLRGDTNDFSNAVVVPFDLVIRANNEIIDAGRRKIIAMRKSVEFRRKTLCREWRHGCTKITLQDMKEELKVLQSVKVTRDIRYYLHNQSRYVETEKDAKIYDPTVVSTKEIFQRMLENEKKRVAEASREVTIRQKQNKMLLDAIAKTKSSRFKVSTMANDETRDRDRSYRLNKIIAIARRTRLAKKINENYGELVAMRTQIELLKLKTYPTLRFNKIRDRDNATTVVDKS